MSRAWWIIIGALFLSSVFLRHPLLFLMSLFLALLAGASQLWSHYCLTNVTYERLLDRTRLFWGEEAEMRIEVVNAKLLPLAWLRADDEFPEALDVNLSQNIRQDRLRRRRLVNVFSLRWYERVVRRYRIYGIQRGMWKLGPTQLRSGDIFGFDIKRKTLPDEMHVLVYPRMVPITALGFPNKHPFGDHKSLQRIVEDPLRLMGARAYVQGDNFRHIHWKATARRQELQTKVFEPSASRPIAIFLNIDVADEGNYGMEEALREYAITAAASISRQVWEDGHALGLYSNTLLRQGSLRVRIQPRRHPDQLIYVLDALAQIEENVRWPIERVLRIESGGLAYGTTVVVISTILNRELRQALEELGRRGYGVVLLALGSVNLERSIPNVQYHHIGGQEEWESLEFLEFGGNARAKEPFLP